MRRVRAQDGAFAALDREAGAHRVSGPVEVEFGGETFQVPLTVKDVRAALGEEDRTVFDREISAAAPNTIGRLLRRWALVVIPGDELDRRDVLLLAEQRATGAGVSAG
ncbi:hypothetical protein [Streptomyces sp. NPDC051567]|uniref:hypothetical protein n=1 Tax=Streptomyces sp. NPDC051567 TaxID=3365660 RepID=UPI0037952BC7